MLKYEHHREPLLPRAAFLQRLFAHVSVAMSIVLGSLAIGVAGYRFLERLDWIDALLNAAMLLGGMGPVNKMCTFKGKLFAAFYALYSGIVFLVVAGVLFAPVFHRFLHRFHLAFGNEDQSRESDT